MPVASGPRWLMSGSEGSVDGIVPERASVVCDRVSCYLVHVVIRVFPESILLFLWTPAVGLHFQ